MDNELTGFIRNCEFEAYQRLAWQPDLTERLRSYAMTIYSSDKAAMDLIYEAMHRIDAQRNHIDFLTKKYNEAIHDMRFCAYCGAEHVATNEACAPEPVPTEPVVLCKECSGSGSIANGIDEASCTICNVCDGTGQIPIDSQIATSHDCFVYGGSGNEMV